MNSLKAFLPLAILMSVIPNTVVSAEIECRSRELSINDEISVETQCREKITVNEAVDETFYSYSPPFLEGVSIPNTLADILGISLGGNGFLGIKAFGFPEQKIGWDGLALENTYRFGLRNQELEYPINTKAVGNGFCSGLSIAQCFSD